MFGARQTGKNFRGYAVRIGLLLVALYFVHRGEVWDDLRGTLQGILPLASGGRGLALEAGGEGRAEMDALTIQIQARDEEIVRLYRRLATLSHFREHFADAYPRALPARVIFRRDGSSLRRFLTLDRGSNDGIGIGAPVIWGEGLIGLVKVVAPGTCEVVLVTDPTCRIDAYVREKSGDGHPGKRQEGILVGHPPEGCRLEFVPRTVRGLRVGSTVLTTGWRGRVPGDMILGTVGSVKPGVNTSLLEIHVQPSVDVDSLGEVVVLLRREIRSPSADGVARR